MNKEVKYLLDELGNNIRVLIAKAFQLDVDALKNGTYVFTSNPTTVTYKKGLLGREPVSVNKVMGEIIAEMVHVLQHLPDRLKPDFKYFRGLEISVFNSNEQNHHLAPVEGSSWSEVRIRPMFDAPYSVDALSKAEGMMMFTMLTAVTSEHSMTPPGRYVIYTGMSALAYIPNFKEGKLNVSYTLDNTDHRPENYKGDWPDIEVSVLNAMDDALKMAYENMAEPLKHKFIGFNFDVDYACWETRQGRSVKVTTELAKVD